ncbi:hypothetical protein GCM10018790_01590 [Kitasatospora xanthocidica]|uniref:hypothetical protein n=1 Tax=Kitasatospora xanthocidica TaxID=83382 RepID=UPI00167BFD78|nr:hypothetical protein [Kitasatospora xanthocidica]BFD92241.1 hypothetical protein KitaXyl93_36010 [Kitasatospora sp. Xyl93]GHF27887.1 hypothetical protein GCM10018790_01590 [Kitasatospora xanthocidica]
MASDLSYRELVRQVRQLAREVRRDTAAYRTLAQAQKAEAEDTGRIAEQIAALKVDAATVAETHEVAKVMKGLSDAAIAYASAAEETGRTAADTESQAHTDHDGIQQAVDSSSVPMADRTWYTQE